MNSKKSKKFEFSIVATKVCEIVGSIWSFLTAALFCIVWLISGPLFHYSDTWQLVINTVTTLITFLIVFLLQNSQNRDTEILNLKLDELIKAIKAADNRTLNLDELTEAELKKLIEHYKHIKNKSTGS